MQTSLVFRGVVFTAAAVAVEPKKQEEATKTANICRPSELPIYTNEPKMKLAQVEDETASSIENAFRSARENITKVYKEIKAYQQVGSDYFDQSKENVEWLFKYLRQEDNTTPKAGAIAIGGLTGFICGLRGGFFKRTVYFSIGALTMASVCYPKEAAEYSQVGIAEAKKAATIGYNFIYGVKKGDPPLELPSLPKLPGSFSEAWDSVSKSASSLVSGPVDEDAKIPKPKLSASDKPK